MAENSNLNPVIDSASQKRERMRKRGLLLLAGVFVLVAAGYGAYWGLQGRFHESTDDA